MHRVYIVCVVLFCWLGVPADTFADDLDVYLPREGSVAGSSNPAIYWRYEPRADGYLIDLIGPNTSATSCDGVVRAPIYLAADDLDCGAKQVADFGYGDSMPDGTLLCLWYPGDLPEGYFSVSVNAWGFAEGWLGEDVSTRTGCAAHYQSFFVDTPSAPPARPLLQTPVNGLDCELYTRSVVTDQVNGCFLTIADVDMTASWVQLWVNDANDVNLLNQWYPVNSLECVVESGVKRCSFDDISHLPYYGGASPHRWWVRAWNPAGVSAWTPAGVFASTPS